MGGFSYNGIHCTTYGVEYGADASKRWWEDAAFETYKKDVSWHHGGYWFGNAANIREIKLDCYYEEITVADKERIKRWLGRHTSGKLIFDERPFVYYNVRPDSVVTGTTYPDHDKFSGTFTVTFIATEPFGYLTRKSNGSENDGAEDYCGLIPTSMMPAAPTTSSTSFKIYNPGTEQCGMTIRIAGSSSKPIRFFNSRNNTSCVISSLPTNNLILDVNGDTGFVKTYISAASSYSNGFAYHDYGVVRLEPCETYAHIPYTAELNGTMYTVTLSNFPVTDRLIGAKLTCYSPTTRYFNVSSVNKENNTLTCILGGSGTLHTSGEVRISEMNSIAIQEKNNNGSWVRPTTLSMTSIEIDYAPRLL